MSTTWLRGLPPEVRFDCKHFVHLDSGCWEWTGPLFESGYGQFYVDGRNWRAHVWAWENFVGPRTPGLQLDHFLYPDACIGPACVRPDHMRETTARENTLRGNTVTSARLSQTHCIHGHEFTPDNTYYRPDGSRTCRACHARVKHKQQTTEEYRAKRRKIRP